MAGQSGHNLKIAPSRYGCRLPFERSDVGDGYAGAGPLLIRKMTDEEWARYGPATVPKGRDLSRGEVAFVVENAASLAHAARMARVSEARMKKEMARHCIAVPERWKEDVNNMPAIKMTEAEAREKLPPADTGQTAENARPKTRLEILMEKLPKEQYLQLKAEGLSDVKILKQVGAGQWIDLMTIVKKKWGVGGMSLRPPKAGKRVAEPEKTATAAEPQPGVTVADALRIRGEITDDIECLENILNVSERAELTGRVIAMLAWYRDSYRQALARMEEAFSRTAVEL